MANATSTQLQELYIAYFGRAADPSGLDYWTEKGITTAKFAADMYAQAEFKNAYGSKSTETQVNEIYKNLFDRDADVTGLNYWTLQINLGNLKLAEIATHLVWAAQNNSGSSDDKTALTNKTNAAIAYTAKVKESTTAILNYAPTSTDPYVAGPNITEAKTYMAGIDKDTEYTAAGIATSVSSITSNATVTGTTFTLTTGSDNLTGTAGADTFDAPLSAANNTLTSLDKLDGGEGSDTLNAVQGTTGTAQIATLKSIETVSGSFTAAGTISLLGSSGVTAVTNNNSTAAGTVSNIGIAANDGLTLSNTANGGTFAFATGDVTGTADSATLTLSNVTGGTATIAGIETLNIVSSGSDNTLGTLTAAAATTLNVSGSKDLDAGTANTVATTVDASALTGDLTFITDNSSAATITGGSGNDDITSTGTAASLVTIKGGAGNDTITHSANLDVTDVIDGGAGTDTLVSTTALLQALSINTTTAKITNIEAITVSDEYTDNTSTIDVVAEIQASGINTVTLANEDDTATDDITTAAEVIVMGSGSQTLNLGASGAGNQSHLGGTLTVQDTGTGTTDSITINNKSLNSTTSTNVDIFDDGTTDAGLTSTGYENVTFDTGAGTTNQEQATSTLTITPDDTAANVSLTVTGNNGFDIDTSLTTTSTGLLTIDASGMKAQAAGTTTFDINTTAQGTDGTATITGSPGDDVIVVGNFATTFNGGAGNDTLTGGTAADTISGGAGNDTLTGSGGNDTINGEAGNDTITATTAGNYTITGGAGNDTADFGGTLTNADSFDGGDGTDTLFLNNTSATTINAYSITATNTLNDKITSVEKIDFGSTLAQNVDLGRLDGISDVVIDNLAADVTLSGIGATNNFLIKATTGQALTLTLADVTGTSDVVNINLNAAALINANTITAAGVETVNILGDDNAAGDSSTINVLTLTANKATSIVVTGNDGLTLTATGSTKVTNFDASGIAANDANDTAANMAVTYASLNTSSTAAVTIKGGPGNDSLTGNAGIDTITGGAGTDTLTASAGNDVYSGEAGADTFSFTGALLAANSGTTATFAGGAGTDILDISDNAATIVDADFRGITSVETLTTGDGANSITLADNADAAGITSVTGGSGVDTIIVSDVDFDNALTIDTAAGADVITLSTSTDQVVTINIDAGDGVVRSAQTFAGAAAAAADTITFATGAAGTAVEITGFTGGTDKIDFTNTGAAVTGIGQIVANVDEDAIYFFSGAYVNNTGVFTIAADGTGADTLVFENEGTAANDVIATVTNYAILVGVDSDDLTSTTFV
jgi:hypothetical protein